MRFHRQTLLAVLSAVIVTAPAWAVPTQLLQQGRLLDSSGQPLSGSHTLSFALYDAATAGIELWDEEHTVAFDNGYYTVTLGEFDPVDDLLFSAGPVWLELTVDGGLLQPRQQVSAVPWALRAASAEHLDGGVVDAAEVSVAGSLVIDSSGAWVGATPSVAWGDLSGVPADLGDGDQDTLSDLVCLTGEVAKWAGGAWACAQDIDTDTDDNTQLSESTVELFVTNDALPLATGSTVGGQQIVLEDSNGNVGLGTTAPDTKLHVQDGQVRIRNAGGPHLYVTDQTSGSTDAEIRVSSSTFQVGAEGGGGQFAVNLDTGDVGIGTTSPTARLEVAGNMRSSDPSGRQIEIASAGRTIQFSGGPGAEFIIRNDSQANDSNNIKFRLNDNDVMYLQKTGDVGIGTTSPTATLDVAGNIAYQANGAVAQVHNWGAEGSFVMGTGVLSTSWSMTQSIDLPSAGTYLVLSNFRIRRQTGGQSFVKAELRWDGGTQTAEDRMVCENVAYHVGWNNYGGSVSWVIDVATPTTLEAWYLSQDGQDRWWNDSNGVPRLVAVRLY